MKRLLIAGIFAACAAAQGLTDPPPIIQFIRTPGRAPSLASRYVNAKAAVDVIGMTSLTGLPEAWCMEAHPNFASLGALSDALTATAPAGPANAYGEAQDELLGAPRTIVAIHENGWGYRPGGAVKLFPKARFFRVSIYRMRPGGDALLQKLLDARKQAFNQVNLDRPDIVYRVISGAPAGTYLILAPLTSLKAIDDAVLQIPAYLEPLAAAEAELDSSNGASIIAREHLLFRVDPRLSYVSAGFAGADADFWKPQRQ